MVLLMLVLVLVQVSSWFHRHPERTNDDAPPHPPCIRRADEMCRDCHKAETLRPRPRKRLDSTRLEAHAKGVCSVQTRWAAGCWLDEFQESRFRAGVWTAEHTRDLASPSLR
jgi:hypothetical protein